MKSLEDSVHSMEYNILKTISVNLDDTYILILSYMYYSNKAEKKSEYRFEGVIDTKDNFLELAKTYINNPVEKWFWPNSNLPVKYKDFSTQRRAASWLEKRIKDALTWEEFQKQISKEWRNNGWISEGYSNSEIENLDLKSVTPEFLKNLSEKKLHVVSDKAFSVKPKYI